MGSKIAPSWPQERPGSGAKSIFKGLEVELLLGKLGLWEEGREEGKPSPHTV